MSEKKEQNRFTIQFSPADPAHRQVIAILNQQGRRKAQFIVNAVQHYLHCSETPEIPQAPPLDTRVLEEIVRHILEEQQNSPQENERPVSQPAKPRTSEDISLPAEAEELLGEDDLAAITNTIAMFRK